MIDITLNILALVAGGVVLELFTPARWNAVGPSLVASADPSDDAGFEGVEIASPS